MHASATLIEELAEVRPKQAVGLLSREEKDRQLERSVAAIYRWYLARSQAARNWNPDLDFDWTAFSSTHSDALNTMLEGFYAVEQYVPDYVANLLKVIRRRYGRSQFQVRWGAEEQRHMDAWRNTVLFARRRSPRWIEQFTDRLRDGEWLLPWDDPLHMLFYTVIQERATQVTYVNTAAIAAGRPGWEQDKDPVLEQVCRKIAVDEAAHYNFFNECARLHLYYYPAEALQALVDVLNYFAMPGQTIIPNFAEFEEIVARSAVFGPRQYSVDVLRTALRNLDVNASRAVALGVQAHRRVPGEDGAMLDTTVLFSAIDYPALEGQVRETYRRIAAFEGKTGRAALDPVVMLPSGLGPDLPSKAMAGAPH
jgi:acyl-[acyl-carrier-protein] desaturase